MFTNKLAALLLMLAASQAANAVLIYQSSFEGTDGGWVGTGDWERGIVSTNTTIGGVDAPAALLMVARRGLQIWTGVMRTPTPIVVLPKLLT